MYNAFKSSLFTRDNDLNLIVLNQFVITFKWITAKCWLIVAFITKNWCSLLKLIYDVGDFLGISVSHWNDFQIKWNEIITSSILFVSVCHLILIVTNSDKSMEFKNIKLHLTCKFVLTPIFCVFQTKNNVPIFLCYNLYKSMILKMPLAISLSSIETTSTNNCKQ